MIKQSYILAKLNLPQNERGKAYSARISHSPTKYASKQYPFNCTKNAARDAGSG
jgi:hypothetical protein